MRRWNIDLPDGHDASTAVVRLRKPVYPERVHLKRGDHSTVCTASEIYSGRVSSLIYSGSVY